MHSHLDTTPVYNIEEQVTSNPPIGLINAKKYCAHELYTKNMTDWPKTSNELFFNEPNAVDARFIKLCYSLKKQNIDLRAEEYKAEKKNLQKIFAYLLNSVAADSEKVAEKQRMFLCFNLFALCPELISTKDDPSYILSHISQNKRSWLKVCIAQALRNRKEALELQQKKSGNHDMVLDVTYLGSELANIGIVLQEVVGGVFLGQHWIDIGIAVSRYTNPLIYGFKVMQRLLKLAGRTLLGLEFAEDEVGINPKQNLWDGVSAALFLTVTVLLSINMPILTAAAWLIAPIGLSVVWKSEYGYQNQCASYRQKNMKESEGLFDKETQAEADRIALHRKISSLALLGVIVFICVGMLATHAAGIPGLDLIFNEYTLGAISMITGIALAGLAVFRASNFLWERKGPAIKAALKDFFAHPVDNTISLFKAIGKYMVSAVKSIPDKLESLFQYLAYELPDKIVKYWNSMGTPKKVALVFTLASLALSISVLAGGLPVMVGLVVAGVCSLVASIIKYAPAIHAAIKTKEKPKSEVTIEPYQNDLECNKALDCLAAHHGLIISTVLSDNERYDTAKAKKEEHHVVPVMAATQEHSSHALIEELSVPNNFAVSFCCS